MLSPEQLLIKLIFDVKSDRRDVPQEFGGLIYKHIIDSNDKYTVTHTPVIKRDVPIIDLMNSNMIPQNIAQRIKSYDGNVRKTAVNFSDDCLPITFFKYCSPTEQAALSRELLSLLPIIKWMADTYSGTRNKLSDSPNKDPLVVHLFMGDDKKYFPETLDTTISYEHCNAAVTWACKAGGEILIYRKEEWGKTLIHELFHALCLDMISDEDGGEKHEAEINEELKRLFHLPGKPAFRETYCEVWATILYCAAIAHNHIRETDTLTVHHFNTVFSEFIIIERRHAFIQMSKILRFWKLNWCDFLKHHMCKNADIDRPKRDIPKEGTNVFCYFILRCILLYDIGKTFRILNPTIKRKFDANSLKTCIQTIAYSDNFDMEIQSHDRVTQVILSRVNGSRMEESHKSNVVSHISGTFRMTALSGWMI